MSDDGPCSVPLSGGLLDVVLDVFLGSEVWNRRLGVIAIGPAIHWIIDDVLNSSVECGLSDRFASLLLDDGSVLFTRRCRCYGKNCPRLRDFLDNRVG